MPKRLTEKQHAELEVHYRACMLILDYVEKEGSLGAEIEGFRADVRNSYGKQDLKGLRLVRSDFEEWIEDLPEPDQRALAKQMEGLGVSFDDDREQRRLRLSQIVNRGRIQDEDEYRLVLRRVEEIYSDPSNDDEVRRLNELLAAF